MTHIKRNLETKTLSYPKSTQRFLSPAPPGRKNTISRKLMQENRTCVTLDDFEERAIAQNDPALFLQLHERSILIDEIQYAPQLFSYIKIEIDNGADPGSF